MHTEVKNKKLIGNADTVTMHEALCVARRTLGEAAMDVNEDMFWMER